MSRYQNLSVISYDFLSMLSSHVKSQGRSAFKIVLHYVKVCLR
jgi:hypothetical protein